MQELIDKVKFDDKGLVGVIVQDHVSHEVLMFAFMNRESLARTIAEKKACYWSRSRQKLWLKGETSGHYQIVHEIRIDCDADAILIRVEQEGGACHTGYRSCFYRVLRDDSWVEDGQKIFSPADVYKK